MSAGAQPRPPVSRVGAGSGLRRLGGAALAASPEQWRSRTLRWLLIYLVLTGLTVTTRYLTRDVRPTLRTTEAREVALLAERDRLQIEVQRLTTYGRVQNWAQQNGMVPFAEADKVGRDLGTPATAAPLPSPEQRLKVNTEWN